MLKRLFPLLAVVGWACSAGPTDDGAVDLLVRSDKPSYSLTVDHSAVPLLINRSGRPVYLPMNEYVVVEHLAEGTWQQGVGWFAVDGDGVSFAWIPAPAWPPIQWTLSISAGSQGNTALCLRLRWIRRVARDSHTPRPARHRLRYDPKVVARSHLTSEGVRPTPPIAG
jgi:hypothetical protein